MAKNNLQLLRKNRGLTQAQLAEMTGFEQGTVQRHESGTRDMNIETIKKYAAALECTPADIIGDNLNNDPLAPDEKAVLENYRKMKGENKQLYLHMGEALQTDSFEHGGPKKADERKTS